MTYIFAMVSHFGHFQADMLVLAFFLSLLMDENFGQNRLFEDVALGSGKV